MSSTDFYQSHLDRVSRSFALCISRLESPLRKWVSLTYLICRILDTVEDAKWAKQNAQLTSFVEFDSFINSPEALESMASWVQNFPTDISEGEKLLLQDAKKILLDLHQAPSEVRGPIRDLVLSMSAGMRHFVTHKTEGALRLRGVKEVNQYCFFVAGIVGETLSKLLSAVDANVKVTKPLIVDAHHFGLFLQKVNLLKDQMSDEKEGRFFISSSRDEIYTSLKNNAEGAMRYIEAIPVENAGYRVFCLWSLFLGLRTLPLLHRQSASGMNNSAVTELGALPLAKISRDETLQLFGDIEKVASQPKLLRQGFNSLLSQADFATRKPHRNQNQGTAPWINSVYQGILGNEDFAALDMA